MKGNNSRLVEFQREAQFRIPQRERVRERARTWSVRYGKYKYKLPVNRS